MIRAVASRLLGAVLFAAIAVVSAWVAIESVARLAGRSRALLSVDYSTRWDDLSAWNPSDAAQTGLWLATIAVGLVLLGLALGRSRGPRRVTLDQAPEGDITLNSRGVGPLVRSQLAGESWVSQSHARVRIRGNRVNVSDAPTTGRPWAEEEVVAARRGVAAQITRIGLEPGTLAIEPRKPAGRVQ